jgi:hypothetical protein
LSAQHPIKANPVKTGDAKLWVYRRENGYDCQAAEDHNIYMFVITLPGLYKSGIFYLMTQFRYTSIIRKGSST